MLPLHGVAQETRGFDSQRPWQVLRLRSPNIYPSNEADTALLHSPADATLAKSRGFSTAFGIGENLEVGDDAPTNLILASGRFGYLACGDVLGFQPAPPLPNPL